VNLLRFIREHRSTALLVVLSGLSLVSLASGTESTLIHQGVVRAVSITAYPFLQARAWAEARVEAGLDFVFRYASLREENDALRREIVEMRKSLAGRAELRRENARLRQLLEFERDEPRLQLQLAKVLQSSKGILTIDRGRAHDVAVSTAVLTDAGVVGVVTEVGDFTARVATLHHPSCRIGAMVQRNRVRAYDGVVHASGSLTRMCTMEYIDLNDDVRVGDRVVTSPESVFPAGYPIGRINAPPHGTNTLWRWAEVEPFVDPYRLDEVFLVVGASPSAELLGAEAPDPALPERESLQEQYAP